MGVATVQNNQILGGNVLLGCDDNYWMKNEYMIKNILLFVPLAGNSLAGRDCTYFAYGAGTERMWYRNLRHGVDLTARILTYLSRILLVAERLVSVIYFDS
jgi:hypothetical protein